MSSLIQFELPSLCQTENIRNFWRAKSIQMLPEVGIINTIILVFGSQKGVCT